MWLPKIGLLLLALCASPSVSREITHEDIKEAIIGLVHLMRENTDKLERHEARERQLGDKVTKSIILLSKKVSAVDGLKTHLNRIDERIAGVEKLISQRDERERIQIQKTADTIEDLEARLKGWLRDIETKVSEVNNRTEPTKAPQPDENVANILVKLNDTEASIAGQIAKLEFGLDVMKDKTKTEANIQANKLQTVFNEVMGIGARLGGMESALGKLEESSSKQEEPESIPDLSPAIEKQSSAIAKLKELLEDTSERIRDLPRVSDVQIMHNETQTSLQETKHAVEDVIARGIDGINARVVETKDEIKNSVGNLRTDLANNAERVNEELQGLGKSQSVIVSTADQVLDTKKRVEYGIHQILLEVGNDIKAQSAEINSTLNQRFTGLSNAIMNNQTEALANLTTKMEQGMTEVWRQITVMYQQMMTNGRTLDELQKQNEAYINSTSSTVDGMGSKVFEISNRTSKVADDLNYLLTQLSFVTNQFNSVKTELGTTLEKIKESFGKIRKQADEINNPGPHLIPANDMQIEKSDSNKSSESRSEPVISQAPTA